jgi:hypothetical protein
MERTLSAACLVFLSLWPNQAQAQDTQVKPPVTLALSRVRGKEYWTQLGEGPMKGQKIREVIFACDVVIDNQTGEDLTVLSSFFSAFDGLSIVLLKEGKELRDQSYLVHQSPFGPERPFVLKKGKNEGQLRFPISGAPDDWTRLEVKIRGGLPGSKYEGKLISNAKKIERVTDLSK